MKLKSLIKNELTRIISGAVLFSLGLLFEHIIKIELTAIILYIASILVSGIAVFFDAVRGILRRDLLDEKFLMSIASIGAMIIGDMSEGAAVMLFFLVGEFFEHKAVRRSRNSIRSLMAIRPDEACILEGDAESIVDAEDVPIGSIIIVRTGERIPIDSLVLSGSADIDTSTLTGESIPRSVDTGCEVESGTLVINGYIKCQTLRLADESAASRILELVENASENKAREENFITKFSRVYTPIVVGLALLMAIIPPLIVKGYAWTDSIYAALTFLVISCPCALVISVPMAFFGGIGGAASKGILFKGGNVFASLARADSIAFDKTGTLTTGKFSVTKVETVEFSESELCYYAACAEYSSTHPIAEAIKAHAPNCKIPEKCDEKPGRGIVATVDSHIVAVGNQALLKDLAITFPELPQGAVYVAIDGSYKGSIYITDEIKREAEVAIRDLKTLGVKRSIMLSGDRESNAQRVGLAIGITEIHAELFPDEKYTRLQQIINDSNAAIYVGDGINDAPSLAGADVGIAMGGVGSDSAIEAADIVIMTDNLTRIPTAIKIARKTLGIAKVNIVFALGVKIAILVMSAIGFANMWLAVFADVGVAVIAILNSMRALKIKE